MMMPYFNFALKKNKVKMCLKNYNLSLTKENKLIFKNGLEVLFRNNPE